MDVSDIFKDYCTRVAQVHFQRKLIEDAVRREVARLHEQEHQMSELSMPADEPISTQNMSFKSATSGELRFYGFASSTARALIEAQIAVVNRQYQWLLVDAYELFEDYLEGIYASMAVTDKSSWPLRDFGEATIDELSGKGFDWYLEKSRNKKEVPYSILNRIRVKHPTLGHVERANRLNVHLLLAVVLIEKMRHHIVHTRGVVAKPDHLYAKVLKQAGLSNGGSASAGHKQFLDTFLRLRSSDNTILLLSVRGETVGPLQVTYDVFEATTNFLLSYAELVRDTVSAK